MITIDSVPTRRLASGADDARDRGGDLRVRPLPGGRGGRRRRRRDPGRLPPDRLRVGVRQRGGGRRRPSGGHRRRCAPRRTLRHVEGVERRARAATRRSPRSGGRCATFDSTCSTRCSCTGRSRTTTRRSPMRPTATRMRAPTSTRSTWRLWHALEGLVDEGVVRHLGTSNVTIPKLTAILADARIAPALNEMELHPCFQQPELFRFCLDHGIQPVGYSPLGSPSRPERDRIVSDVSRHGASRRGRRSPARTACIRL